MNEQASPVNNPHDVYAESALVSALLIDCNRIIDLPGDFTGQEFYLDQHRQVFDALQEVWGKTQDANIVTVHAELVKREQAKDLGGMEGLTKLIESCPAEASVKNYAALVTSAFKKRRLIQIAGDIAEAAIDPALDGDEAEGKAITYLMTLSENAVSEVEASSIVVPRAVARIIDRFKNPEKYQALKTPWEAVNNGYGGLAPGEMQIVAGRPGMGKSLFVGQWRDWLASQETPVPVGMISLEMNEDELIAREIARVTGLDSNVIRTGTFDEADLPKIIEAEAMLRELPIYWETSGSCDLPKAYRMISSLVIKHQVRVVFVDYIQLLEAFDSMAGGRQFKGNRALEIGMISRTLKRLAMALNITIVVTAQLNRGVEQRDNKRPRLSDLRESGTLEQDASVVFMLYRDDYYDPDVIQPNLVECNKVKDRNGKSPHLAMLYLVKALTLLRDVEFKVKEGQVVDDIEPPPEFDEQAEHELLDPTI
jgi:replicative DNA helicase